MGQETLDELLSRAEDLARDGGKVIVGEGSRQLKVRKDGKTIVVGMLTREQVNDFKEAHKRKIRIKEYDETRHAWDDLLELMASTEFSKEPEKFENVRTVLTRRPSWLFTRLVNVLGMLDEYQGLSVKQTEAVETTGESIKTLQGIVSDQRAEIHELTNSKGPALQIHLEGGKTSSLRAEAFRSELTAYLISVLRTKPNPTDKEIEDIAANVCNIEPNSPALRWKHTGTWTKADGEKWNAKTKNGKKPRSAPKVVLQIKKLLPEVQSIISARKKALAKS